MSRHSGRNCSSQASPLYHSKWSERESAVACTPPPSSRSKRRRTTRKRLTLALKRVKSAHMARVPRSKNTSCSMRERRPRGRRVGVRVGAHRAVRGRVVTRAQLSLALRPQHSRLPPLCTLLCTTLCTHLAHIAAEPRLALGHRVVAEERPLLDGRGAQAPLGVAVRDVRRRRRLAELLLDHAVVVPRVEGLAAVGDLPVQAAEERALQEVPHVLHALYALEGPLDHGVARHELGAQHGLRQHVLVPEAVAGVAGREGAACEDHREEQVPEAGRRVDLQPDSLRNLPSAGVGLVACPLVCARGLAGLGVVGFRLGLRLKRFGLSFGVRLGLHQASR
eukprot:scaffold74682_cov75-Phaeocystis_antarctica.AAC.1